MYNFLLGMNNTSISLATLSYFFFSVKDQLYKDTALTAVVIQRVWVF